MEVEFKGVEGWDGTPPTAPDWPACARTPRRRVCERQHGL